MTKTTKVKTFNITIYMGLREGYEGRQHTIEEAYKVLQMYCDLFPFCVSIFPTKYIYHRNSEDGIAVNLINYARFPSDETTLLCRAREIGDVLMNEFNQFRYSIVADDFTYLVERDVKE